MVHTSAAGTADSGAATASAASAASALRLRAPANLVSRRALWYWTARAAIVWVLAVAVEVFVLIELTGDRAPMVALLAVTVLLAAAHLIVMPQWRFRVHRWEVSDTAVYTQSGWFTQERRIAPLSRIQTVDTERGPLEQLFRLSNVTVTTASAAGPLRIHGLDRVTADRLTAELTAATSARNDDAT